MRQNEYISFLSLGGHGGAGGGGREVVSPSLWVGETLQGDLEARSACGKGHWVAGIVTGMERTEDRSILQCEQVSKRLYFWEKYTKYETRTRKSGCYNVTMLGKV